MRVVFMGTPGFALHILKALFDSRHQIVSVITQPDKRGNRGIMCPPAVKVFAQERGLPVKQYAKIRAEGVQDLKALNADIFITAAYGQLLSKEILDIAPYGTINVHASILPAYRGSCPVQRAIMCGEKETGVTIMQTAEGLDTGDILYVKRTDIDDSDTADSLMEKLSILGAQALLECLDKLENGEITPVRQDEAAATYYPMLEKTDGLIDWSKSADELDHIIRGVTPWPGAYTYRNGKMLKLHKAYPSDECSDLPAGSVVRVNKQGITVSCGKGTLILTELQLEGKKRMTCCDFLNGCRLTAGEILG